MTVTLAGRAHTIDIDGDVNDNGRPFMACQWAGDAPECPACHDPLTAFGEDDSRDVPIEHRYAQDPLIVCQSCGFTTEVA